jgi:alpha-amylase
MRSIRFVLLALLFISFSQSFAQTRVKKVVFQGFWWDYYNANYKNKWADYLTELTPRLRAAGIDAVWIPSALKTGSTGSVGYNPFDHYDLGDKYQKGGGDSLNVRTRLGNKDELLRMVAVLHANGMEAIEDVVMNHINEAGTNVGTGGRDPQSPYSIANANGYKNFRYVSYATPLIDESQNDYWTRNGRWPKNYTNFYPNASNNCTTGDICTPYFGPDVSYEANAIGRSSNIPTTGTATIGAVKRNYVNPTQASDYMRTQARSWLQWFKKQTGVDGWRWDAVKHFPIFLQQDLIYNTKYSLPAFANGGQSMFCVGEWIGSKTDLDNYVTAVRSGTEEHTGTFDFSLRGYGPNGGLYSMALAQGNYNMQFLPGEQQNKRYFDYAGLRVHRTAPFVNNHDTYRPILDASGNFSKPLGDVSGWNTGSELGGNGQHIDPREPRLAAAYATIFSMDGNPVVFFEDLFDLGTIGKRFTHLPNNPLDLPIRPDIQNIIQCHQRLAFKDGDYAVPTSLTGAQAPFYAKGSSGDHLVIERTRKALIGISDKYSTVSDNSADEEVWVTVTDTSWRGKDLIDYSGAHGLTTTRVFADGRVLIKTAPVGHTIAGARGHGYSVWAPVPSGVVFATIDQVYTYLGGYQPPRATATVQEWEMADDLGDSHAKSLRQGGQLPAKSTAQRVVGSIFTAAGKPITVLLYPSVNGSTQVVTIYSSTNQLLATKTGTSSNTAPLQLNFTPTTTGWHQIRVNSSTATQVAQRVWVNVNYTAPPVVNTRTGTTQLRNADPVDEMNEWMPLTEIYPNPTDGRIRFNIPDIRSDEPITIELFSSNGIRLFSSNTLLSAASDPISRNLSAKRPGLYFIHLRTGTISKRYKVVRQ